MVMQQIAPFQINFFYLDTYYILIYNKKNALIQGLEWKYATFPFTPIGEWKVPEAGYFKIETGDLTINYLPYVLD